ncbi:MAG: hydrolase [Desulfobulbus sp.]|nr:hydrolase [Desulfobulbus sp.]
MRTSSPFSDNPSVCFEPPVWLRNPHIQTLWPKLFRRRPALPLTSQRINLADGDFIDLTWAVGCKGSVVLILHGLEGNLDSHYALPVMDCLARAGLQPVFMHLRGCSHEPNRSARTYHSGAIEDLEEVLLALYNTDRAVAAALGFSLGGNILLRYLGMRGDRALLKAAMAVSVPFVLADAARRLEQGSSRFYQSYLLARLKRTYKRKLNNSHSSLQVNLNGIRTIRQYDEHITAPLNGFAGADDYYHRCSSIGYLTGITIPTLLLHSLDDPFMYPGTSPRPDQLGPGVRPVILPHGGHVGFVHGTRPWRTAYLVDQLAPAFFSEALSK